MKKIFQTIAAAFLVSTGAFAQTQTQAQDISSRIESNLPTSLPNLFNGVKICLDPGHGGHNGANDRYIFWMDKYINKYNSADEYDLSYWESNGNFYTALYMREVLQELGAQVKLTREKNDNDIVNGSYGNGGPIGSSDPTLSNREAISNAFGAKYFQSIHTNAAGSVPGASSPDVVDYVRIFVPNSYSSTQTAVASKMAAYHAGMNYTHDTKAQVHSYSVTNNVNAYASLTEGGFHTQMAEARRLRSTLYLQANAMAWVKSFVAQEGKESLITWGEIGGIAYSEEATEYNFGNPKDGRGLEFGLGMNEVKVILDKGTAKERSIIVDENELDANYNEGEYVSGGNHVTKNGGYNGYYYFNFVSPGSHTLTFQKAGVATKTQTVNVLRGKHLKNDVLLNVIGQPASAPYLTLAEANGVDGVSLTWNATYSAQDLIGYRVLYATDDTKSEWKIAVDESTLKANATSVNIVSKSNFINATAITPKHYKVVAVTSAEGEVIVGKESEVLSKYNGTLNSNILVVEGFDRKNGAYTSSSNFIQKYIYAIASAKNANISSTLNEFVIDGSVKLEDFDAVVWVLGDESATNSTFAWNERSLVDDYLISGGNLFVSGSEIGWDLDVKGDVNDKAFYADYLKATFVADGSKQTSASGVSSTIMDGVSIALTDTYTAGYADEISANGSTVVMKYANGKGAGVYYKGIFGNGTKQGTVMHLSFPLETSSIANMSTVLAKYFNQLNFGTPVFSAPIANKKWATTNQDTAIAIDVTVNDTDADNDLDVNSIVIVNAPVNGVAVAENGKVTYTPNANYFGNDTFTYTVADAQGLVSNEEMVYVTINEVITDCILTATSTDTYFVRYVLFNDVDNNELLLNSSVADGGYADNTDKTIDVVAGNEYRTMLRGKYGIDNNVNNSYWKVYVDYDKDGFFDGANEELVSKQGDAYGFYNFVVNADAEIGTYTLRVVTSSEPIACGTISAGEVEDYTLNVIPEGLTATSDANHYISSFKVYEADNTANIALLNDESNGNGNNNGYGDFTANTFELSKETAYKLNIGLKYGVATPRNFKVWIDYNNDGNFNGTNEEVYATSTAVTGWFAGDVILPADVAEGTYTLRVAMNASLADNTINPTGVIDLGEVEDYTVNIIDFVETASYSPIAVDEQEGTSTNYEWISYVKVGTESHSSANDNGYADYSDVVFHMVPGVTSSLNLNPGYAGTAYKENWKVWIDLNQDGDFADAGEEVYAIPTVASGWVTGSLTIPAETLPGNYRMRIAMNGSSSNYTLTPGVDFAFGEVQDYIVNVEYSAMAKSNIADVDEVSVEVKAYPNPTVNNLTVEFAEQTTSVYVMSINGAVVYENLNPTEKVNINTSAWNNGVYVVIVNGSNGREVVKVVKN
ncbi:MAG: N-acetylmuramoyl-L-alanine amidase [Ichthyobacteriaceae bacterium]|nr:N-acetylmuramoyl-L-alanine amidase [Ichthyobacteriaceae bacterium]